MRKWGLIAVHHVDILRLLQEHIKRTTRNIEHMKRSTRNIEHIDMKRTTRNILSPHPFMRHKGSTLTLGERYSCTQSPR
jgi:hypothetical protein